MSILFLYNLYRSCTSRNFQGAFCPNRKIAKNQGRIKYGRQRRIGVLNRLFGRAEKYQRSCERSITPISANRAILYVVRRIWTHGLKQYGGVLALWGVEGKGSVSLFHNT